MEINRKTLTVAEAAAELGICLNAAYAAVKRGEIPIIQVGRRKLVPAIALERLLNAPGTEKPASAHE